jgi:hypothetical protein
MVRGQQEEQNCTMKPHARASRPNACGSGNYMKDFNEFMTSMTSMGSNVSAGRRSSRRTSMEGDAGTCPCGNSRDLVGSR